ncbi:Sialyltransferase PMO188 [Brevinema andersonii]|uniref:Sialyltransferase PMO188 n=2 Tax=Brevinema andersonii TaxID=34097 RepID=A0A1I1D4F5_BREAD|nr:Sialyltransferase PMO188 [Brevinema andersonii]
MQFFSDAAKNPDILKLIYTPRFTNNFNAIDNIRKHDNIDSLLLNIKQILKKYPSVKIELHTQIHPFKMYSDVLRAIPTNRLFHVYVYDDGSEDYVNFYINKKTGRQKEVLKASDEAWQKFFSGESNLIGHRNMIAKYLPVTHYMLRPDYLDHSDMKIVKDAMTQNNAQIKKIDFDNLRMQLSELEKKRYFKYIGFNYKKIKKILCQSSNFSFVFTGSAVYDDPQRAQKFVEEQINMIKNVIQPEGILHKYLNGKTYDFFLKLHPHGGDSNKKTKNAFPDFPNIPNFIGYEALIVSGLIPDRTGGFLSSLYFNLPKEKIAFLVASVDKTEWDDPLVQVMIELGIIRESSIYFLSDLKLLN